MPIDSLSFNNMNLNDVSSGSLENKIRDSRFANATDAELMAVSREFEAYFLEQMFRSMQRMVPESSQTMSSSTRQLQEFFRDEMVREIAGSVTQQNNGLGLAQMLFEQMRRNYPLPEVSEDTPEASEVIPGVSGVGE